MNEIQKPTPEDLVRDPQADMAVCDAATPGPWVPYQPGDDNLWWWVWQKSKLPYYGGVADLSLRGDDVPGALAQTCIEDLPVGTEQEKKDAHFMALAREALPAYIRLYVDALCRMAGTDWRTCPDCGRSWPHPSVTSYLRCPNCRSATLAAAVKELEDEVAKLEADRDKLLAAIRRHMNYRGDDRCCGDDHELYSVLPEGDTRPERETLVTIENCQHFIACRQIGREYVSPQRRIEELEADRERLLAACRLWDEGFTEGEQFTPEQFLAWVNRNRKATREAIAQTPEETA